MSQVFAQPLFQSFFVSFQNKTQSFHCMTLSSLSIYVTFVEPPKAMMMLYLSLPTTKAYSGAHRNGENMKEHTCNTYVVKSNNGSKES
jgi:hypothetical protein